ncbi:MAG: HAMP domain-containing histidine kinase [Eubacterium sp.]|nr:HAMP domain-containing histidine kinase [Eubacterium sp.]
MKRFWINIFIPVIVIILLAVLMNVVGKNITEKEFSERNVVAGRINSEIEAELAGLELTLEKEVEETLYDKVFLGKRDEWKSLYGSDNCPSDIKIVVLYDHMSGQTENQTLNQSERLDIRSGSVIKGIYLNDELTGFVEYEFDSSVYSKLLLLMNIALAIAAVIILIYGLWIRSRLILPFNDLSDYPERLSKGQLTEKLPEKKDKFFGRYVWSMNMLSDKLERDRQTIGKMSIERQKFVTTLVHGIKTPTASIKLLAEAIATGLYDPEGRINEKDAELAGKIQKNASDIEDLIEKVMEEGTTAVFEYDPEVEPFYREEIIKFIDKEYSNKLRINRIPYNLESEGNPIINSDKDGIFRILRQLMDNAIKYGDGTGITLSLEKNEEGHFITVKNNGEPLPDTEVVFVFNSMWRGSNSSGVSGNGVGLYEARLIARKLGGDIRMKTGENYTELVLFIPG